MEKYLIFLVLVAGAVLAIMFGREISAAPTASTEDNCLFVPFLLVLMPYTLALLVYVLLRKQFKSFFKELFLHFVLVRQP